DRALRGGPPPVLEKTPDRVPVAAVVLQKARAEAEEGFASLRGEGERGSAQIGPQVDRHPHARQTRHESGMQRRDLRKQAHAHLADVNRVRGRLVAGRGRRRFARPGNGQAAAQLVTERSKQLVAHRLLLAAQGQRPEFGSSRSSMPCSTTRYSPLSRSTISTWAAALTEWMINSPILVRSVAGDVGEASSVGRSDRRNRCIGCGLLGSGLVERRLLGVERSQQ